MNTIQSITFKGILNFLATLNNPKWNVVFQASQFDPKDFRTAVQPATGMLTLNIGPLATRDMILHDEHFEFSVKRLGIEQFMQIPYTAIMEILNPLTGMFIHFPYFLDHGDLDPEELELDNSMALDDQVDTLERPTTEHGFTLRNTFIPTVYNFQKLADEKPVVPKVSTLEKAGLRNWVVIEGGNKPDNASTHPFIDATHHAKQQRRKEQVTMDKFITDKNLKSTSTEINTVDSYTSFPELDVTKCVFHTKKIKRPSWMTVHQGGKQDAA